MGTSGARVEWARQGTGMWQGDIPSPVHSLSLWRRSLVCELARQHFCHAHGDPGLVSRQPSSEGTDTEAVSGQR